MNSFRAFRIHNDGRTTRAAIESLSLDDLSSGDVVIRGAYSSVNYKDALAGSGQGRILRRFPLVGGIDVAGSVAQSQDPRFHEGDSVVVTGCDLGEERDGGYAEFVRVPAQSVIPLPAGMSLYESMAIGTAGFTAALALHRLEANGQHPDLGAIAVTGATGGVGSLAIDILGKAGYQTVALTGKQTAETYLRSLGATHILSRHELDLGARPLEQRLWGGAIDNVGGEMLAWLTRTVRDWGSIASVGLVGGIELHTTVMPFILRGVSVLGINSVHCPYSLRRKLWDRLATDLHPAHLDQVVQDTITLDELPATFDRMLEGSIQGRTVVRLS